MQILQNCYIALTIVSQNIETVQQVFQKFLERVDFATFKNYFTVTTDLYVFQLGRSIIVIINGFR
jgi:hypothetical protein